MSLKVVLRNLEHYIDKATEEIHIDRDKDPRRYYSLRPSSFPYCGLRRLLEANEEKEKPRMQTLVSTYFTKIGSSTHEVFQEFLGRAGRIVGDWVCPNKHWVRFSTYTDCPKCGSPMSYRELEVKYKKTVLGHVDGLFRLEPSKGKKSKHVVIDYKTTSTRKIKERKSPFPYRVNVAQIVSYVPLLEAQYGISVDYWVLAYLTRDAPFKYGRKLVGEALTPQMKQKLVKKLDRSVKVHRKVLKASSREDFKLVAKYKLCKSLKDYETNYHDEYNPCPFSKVCFNEKKLDLAIDTFRDYKQIYPLIAYAPSDVREELGI